MTYVERIIRELCIKNDVTVFWNKHKDGTLYAFINCSDLFYWGCADGEEILESDIEDIIQALEESYDGEALWCARKRKMRPQGAYYKDMMSNSSGGKNNDRELFNACGPEREIDFGNPFDQDNNYEYKKSDE